MLVWFFVIVKVGDDLAGRRGRAGVACPRQPRPGLGDAAGLLRQTMVDSRLQARAYTREYGEDDPAIRDWVWPF